MLTIISMTRLWDESFWKPASQPDRTGMSQAMLIPIVGLTAITLTLSLAAGPFYQLSLRASDQLLNPQIYMNAVLKGGQGR